MARGNPFTCKKTGLPRRAALFFACLPVYAALRGVLDGSRLHRGFLRRGVGQGFIHIALEVLVGAKAAVLGSMMTVKGMNGEGNMASEREWS